MSASISVVEQKEFDAFVKADYQSSGFFLRNGVKTRRDVTGASVDFRRMGQIMSVPTGYGVAVTPQDPGFDKATAYLQKFTTPVYVDKIQDLTVNFDAKMESAQLVGSAMGRRSDQVVIDAFVAASGSVTTIPDGGDNFTYAKYSQMMSFFDDRAIPLDDRFVAMSAQNLRQLMHSREFTNELYTKNRVIDRAWVREFLGFNLITLPSMLEGGLPLAGNIRSAFAWHRQSVGVAIGHDFSTEIHYIPEKTSWLVNGIFSIGAVVIDPNGVLEIENDESVDPEAP